MITTKQDIENYLLIKIDSTFDSQINEWIQAVELEMNKITDRHLVAEDTARTYRYDGTGSRGVMTDDFLTVDEVSIGDSDVTSSCYLYPANDTPKWRVETTGIIPNRRQNVKVVGRRGAYDKNAIPADLKFAATVLVSGIVLFSKEKPGEIASESIGRYSVSYKTDVQKVDYERSTATLARYRRIR